MSLTMIKNELVESAKVGKEYGIMISKIGFSVVFTFALLVGFGLILNLVLFLSYVISWETVTILQTIAGLGVSVLMMIGIIHNARSSAVKNALQIVDKFKVPFCEYLAIKISDQIQNNASVIEKGVSVVNRPLKIVNASWVIRFISGYFIKGSEVERVINNLNPLKVSEEEMRETICSSLLKAMPEREKTNGFIWVAANVALYLCLFVYF